MRRAELARRRVGAYFELNQVVDPTVMRRHRLERFPIHTFFVDAQAAPKGSFRKTWCNSWLMPELVLPDPVSPVINHPRQN